MSNHAIQAALYSFYCSSIQGLPQAINFCINNLKTSNIDLFALNINSLLIVEYKDRIVQIVNSLPNFAKISPTASRFDSEVVPKILRP